MALQCGLSSLAGLPALSWPMPLAGVMAVLPDLDRTDLPPGRTPFCHSALSAVLWCLVLTASASMAAPGSAGGTAFSAGTAFGSHLLLDGLTRDGIYLWPRRARPREWFLPLAPGALLVFEGRAVLDPGSGGPAELLDGDLSWPGWRRLVPGRWPLPEGPRTEVIFGSLGLAGVLLAVVLT